VRIRTKILLAFLFVIILSFGGILLMINHNLDQRSKDFAYKIAIENAHRRGLAIQNEFNQAVAISRTLAYSLGQMNESGFTDVNFIDSLLRAILLENDVYTSVWTVWEPKGFQKDRATTDFNDPLQPLQKAWFQEDGDIWTEKNGFYIPTEYADISKAPHQLVFSNPFKIRGKNLVNVIAPIFVQDEFAGVVGIDLSLGKIEKGIHGEKIFKMSNALLIDANNTIALSPEFPELDDRPISIFNNYKEVSNAVNEHKATGFYGWSDFLSCEIYHIIQPIHIKGADVWWTLLVQIPEASILAPQHAVKRQFIFVGLAGGLCILLLLFFVIKYFARPVGEMSRNLKHLTQGQTEGFENVQEYRNDEIGEMNRSFLHLVDTVKQKNIAEEELLKAKEETDKTNKLITQLNIELEDRVAQRTKTLHQEIQERANTEARLRNSEGVLRIAQSLAKTGSWQINLKNNSARYSREWFKVHNITLEHQEMPSPDLLTKSIFEEDKPQFEKQLAALIEGTENSQNGLYRVVLDKKIKWITWTARRFTDQESGEEMITGAAQDISIRKQYQEHLEDYKLIINTSGELMALLDMDFRFSAINDGFAKAFQQTKSSILNHKMENVFPLKEERDLMYSYLENAAINGSQRLQEWFSIGDDRHYFDLKISPVADASGKVRRLVLSMSDITEMKKTEQQLKVFKRLVDASGLGFGMTDLNACVVYENPTLMKMAGRTDFDGLSGIEIYNSYSPKGSKLIKETIWPHVMQGGQWIGELELLSDKGHVIPSIQNFFLIKDYQNQPAQVAVVITDISKRKAFQDQLEYQARILQNVSDAIISTDKDFQIMTMNSSAEKLFGWHLRELKGKALNEIWHQEEEGFPKIIEDELLLSGYWLGESVLYTRQGKEIHSLTSMTQLKDDQGHINGHVLIINDLTEQIKAQKEQRRSEKNFSSIFQHAAIGIDVIDQNMRFRECNATFMNMIGYEKEEIDALDIARISHPEDWQKNKELTDQLFRREINSYRMEKRYIRKDGSWFWADLSVSTFFGPDDDQLAIGTIIDITSAKNLQEKLKLAMEEANQANHAKSEFLANMSHEIRTPLNSVIGFTELLDSLLHDPKKKSYLNSIKTGGKNLLMLINDILDLSKIEAGRMELHPELVALSAIMEEVRQIFSLRIEEKQLDFSIDIQKDMPDALLLDEVRLRQVMFNLVGNAIKFTHNGFVRIKLRRLFTYNEAIDLAILVEDSGIGIPKDQQQLIFDAFKQQAGQSTRKYGGTGLGLAISKRLVEMMGGEISLVSEAGKGSVFKVVLRKVGVGKININPIKKDYVDFQHIHFENSLVLVVDDIELNRRFLVESLTSKGLRVTEAENGRQALSAMKIEKPDLILMDLRMPVMDGYEATAAIRAHQDWKNIPLIAITASVLSSDREKVVEMGFDAMLLKPIPSDRLFDQLSRFLPFVEGEEDLETEPISQNILENSVPENMKEILSNEKESLFGLWQIAVDHELSEDMESFAAQLNRLADLSGNAGFMAYSRKVKEQIEQFDLDNIGGSLAAFPDEWSRLENRFK